ncbi:hypothetical protein ABFX02_02G056600 [Erythranthe guttata]
MFSTLKCRFCSCSQSENRHSWFNSTSNGATQHQNSHLRELAAAAILSLSSAESNKSTLASSCAPNLLSQVLCSGSGQARVDAVTSLYNLSTSEHEPKLVLDAKAVVPPLISLLKECKKYSKFAEKTTFLLEILSSSEQGRGAITNVDGGISFITLVVDHASPKEMSCS